MTPEQVRALKPGDRLRGPERWSGVVVRYDDNDTRVRWDNGYGYVTERIVPDPNDTQWREVELAE